MQAKKYLFHLSRWGHDGEEEIQKKRKSELPQQIEFKLKIANPKALILFIERKEKAGGRRNKVFCYTAEPLAPGPVPPY